jgi:hypothetical protein
VGASAVDVGASAVDVGAGASAVAGPAVGRGGRTPAEQELRTMASTRLTTQAGRRQRDKRLISPT